MRTTRTLLTAMTLGIGVSFGASAGLVYNNEFTTDWFDAGVQNLTPGATLPSPWQVPKEAGAVTVGDKKITLDTDLEDPLSYGAPSAYSNVAVVAATFTVTPNAACPEIADAPQAALTVVASGGSTNWVGLVGDNGTNKWETFAATSDVPAPVAGETYSVSILFDQRSTSKKIRYLVNGKFLGNDWVANPSPKSSNISEVSFSGSGDITALAGTNVLETAAEFNGQAFSTFDAALAAAEKGGWSDSKPVVLFKDATYEVKKSGQIYINENGNVLTVSGGVFKKSGNTFTITKDSDCEAKIGEKYYATFAEAFGAAADDQTIEVLKEVAGVGSLTLAKDLTLSGCGNLKGCTALTVNAGKVLTLAGALAVGNATVNGSVVGDALTVKNLTGWNVAKLALAENAVITYDADHVLQPTSVSSVTINGLGAVKVGDIVLKAAPTSWTANGLAADKCLEVKNGQLVVASVAEITETSESEGFDYTNGTVSVTATAKTAATATLTVVGWDGTTVKTATKDVTSGTAMTWDVADVMAGALTQGGVYTYKVDIKIGNDVVATKSGEFTAAKWDDDIWFGADASKSEDDRELNGAWDQAKTPAVVGNVYVIEDDALFNVSDEVVDKGTNHVTRVDAVVTFESLIDTDSLESDETDALGGFVAAKSSDVPQWMALTKVSDSVKWVALTGDIAPEVNVQYVVRAEIDFQSATKRVRYLVSTDGGTNFYPLANGTAQWLPLADATKETLAKVELRGAGSLAKFEAWISDKAVAKVGEDEYESMDAALAAAKDNGMAITLLTSATIEPDPKTPGKYEIAPNNHQYVSGGKVSDTARTIIVDGSGNPPVVRPSETVMKGVSAPGLTNGFRDTDSLRAFLERNGVKAYTEKSDATSGDITTALETKGKNDLALWQDYALGIDPTNSVAPVTKPAGDTDPANITLAIPEVVAATPSDDYVITYQVVDKADEKKEPINQEGAGSIKIPLGTGTYEIKAVFTPKN